MQQKQQVAVGTTGGKKREVPKVFSVELKMVKRRKIFIRRFDLWRSNFGEVGWKEKLWGRKDTTICFWTKSGCIKFKTDKKRNFSTGRNREYSARTMILSRIRFVLTYYKSVSSGVGELSWPQPHQQVSNEMWNKMTKIVIWVKVVKIVRARDYWIFLVA